HLKEAAKFVGDFKSLAKEADDSLAKYKEMELDNERLLKAVANVSKNETQQKNQPEIKKSKKVRFIKRLATPKPRKSRILLRWSPTGRLFDQDGKISDSSKSKSQSDYSNGDNACTSNTMEPKNKRFPNSTSLLGSSKPGLQSMTSGHISSGLDLTYASSTITTQQPSEGELDLLFEAMYDDYFGGPPSATGRSVSPVQEPQVHRTSTTSTIIADTAPIPTNSSSHATNIRITSQDVDELNSNAMVDGNTFVNPFANSSTTTVENVPPAQEPQVRQTSTASTTIADNVPIPTNSSSHATNIQITSQDVDELNSNAMVNGNTFVNPFATSSSNAAETSSS
nr:hypothetical protein [Tanacetum cinerariifolium]